MNLNENQKEVLKDVVFFITSLNTIEWAFYNDRGRIKIQLGSLIVLSVEGNDIWLPIGKQDIENISESNYWRLDHLDYPEYRKGGLYSRNGYFSGNYDDWNILRKYYYKYLEEIHAKDYKQNYKTRQKHEIELLDKLVSQDNMDLISDSNIENDKVELESTEKSSLINIRIGQNIFRDKLLRKYEKCMICNINIEPLLVASHIKAWKHSSNSERLDVNNGLLLCRNHDGLFDRFFISFENDGNILISRKILNRIQNYNISKEIKIEVTEKTKKYLDFHRTRYFELENVEQRLQPDSPMS